MSSVYFRNKRRAPCHKINAASCNTNNSAKKQEREGPTKVHRNKFKQGEQISETRPVSKYQQKLQRRLEEAMNGNQKMAPAASTPAQIKETETNSYQLNSQATFVTALYPYGGRIKHISHKIYFPAPPVGASSSCALALEHKDGKRTLSRYFKAYAEADEPSEWLEQDAVDISSLSSRETNEFIRMISLWCFLAKQSSPGIPLSSFKGKPFFQVDNHSSHIYRTHLINPSKNGDFNPGPLDL